MTRDDTTFRQMRDHWWWRPGWRVGRSFYTWHLTFADAPEVHRLTSAYRAQLAGLPGLDPIPDRWLHLTMQGIGFTDEVSEADVTRIAHAAQERLRQLAPFDITLGPAITDPEVVRLRAAPRESVAEVRMVIRDAIADVWGDDQVPEDADSFTPHVSVAYSNSAGPAQPILDAVAAGQPAPAVVTIEAAQLIVLNRDNHQYEWTEYASASLGS